MRYLSCLFALIFLCAAQRAFAQGAVQGTVTDPQGRPLPEAAIRLDEHSGAIADQSGRYRIDNIAAGRYTVRITLVGYAPQVRNITVEDRHTATVDVTMQEQAGQLDQVVVSATRSERALGDLPVPVTVISQEQISRMGSLRLNDVLAEQTGLAVVSDHGTGVQMQGFDPDYTLILLDGEPLIGRTAGVLELSRIAVGNISQVEIVKGPSSGLYGSEALAGVINIITARPAGTQAHVTSRYGTNNTLDLGASLNYTKDRVGIYAFANRYSTDGYDLDTEETGQTVSPFENYTFQTRLTVDVTDKTELSVSGRYFSENQESVTEVGTDTGPVLLNGQGHVSDWNVNPALTQRFGSSLKTTFRFYGSTYKTDSRLTYRNDGQLYDESFFNQAFYRPEIQGAYAFGRNNIFTLGFGRTWESVEATRYDNKITYQTNYVYFQDEWKLMKKLNMLLGGRYDDHSAYGSQFSPKLSIQYDALDWLSVRASSGVGFRAPDFRQLYLNFTNATVGYTVLGANELAEGIARLQSEGQLDEEDILVDPATLGEIEAESSVAWNLGLKIAPHSRWTVNVNAFRNDVKDLIDTRAVAQKNNSQFVYSYVNVHKVFTQGVESDIAWSPPGHLAFSLGYQYLEAKDKSVIDALKKGEVIARDPATNASWRVKESQYGGLFGRSRHMLNAKAFYDNRAKGINATLRAMYRGRYGFADMNGSDVLDAGYEYVDGYVTVNVSVAKTFGRWISLQAGCDNLFDYQDEEYIASLPGRLVWGSVRMTWQHGTSKEEF